MDERIFKKKKIKQTFDTIANNYDSPEIKFFMESATNIINYLDLKGNEHILDVATGTGNAACILAEYLPDGKVTGIDFSEGMLAQAKA